MPAGEDGFKIADGYVQVHLDDQTAPGRLRLIRELQNIQPVKVKTYLDDSGVIRTIKDHRRYSLDAQHAGTFIGEVMGRNWQKSLSQTLTQPQLTGPIVAGLVAVGQSAGALSGAAMTLQLGHEIQKSNAPVAEAIAQLKKQITQGLQIDSGVLVDPFVRAAGDIGRAFTNLRPYTQGVFRDVAPQIAVVTGGLINMAQNALPGVAIAINRSDDAVAGFAEGLGSAGTGVSRFFLAITQDSTVAGTSMRAFGTIISDAGHLIGTVVFEIASVFADVSDEFTSLFTTATSIVTQFVSAGLVPISTALQIVTGAFGTVLAIIEPFSGLLGTVFGAMIAGTIVVRALSGTIGILQTAFTLLTGAALKTSLTTFVTQAGNAAGSAGLLTTKLTGSAAAGDRVANAGGAMVGAFGKVAGAVPVVGTAVLGLIALYEAFGASTDKLVQKVVNGSLSIQGAIQAETARVEASALPWTNANELKNQQAVASQRVQDAIAAEVASMSTAEQAQYKVAVALRAYSDATRDFGPASEQARVAGLALGQARSEEERATHGAELATRSHTQALVDDMNQMLGMANADLAHRQSLHEREKAQRALTDSIRDNGAQSDAAKEAQFRLDGAELQVLATTNRLASEQDGLASDEMKAAAGANAQRAAILEMASSADGRATPAIQNMAAKMDNAALEAHNAAVETSGFGFQVRTLPDGRRVLIAVDANRQPIFDMQNAINNTRGKTVYIDAITRYGSIGGPALTRAAHGGADGGLAIPMATGGLLADVPGRGIVKVSTMRNDQATRVPAGSPRIIGDNLTHPELFVPLDGSRRSLSLLEVGAEHFNRALVPQAATTAASPAPSSSGAGVGGSTSSTRSRTYGDVHVHVNQTSGSPAETSRFIALALRSVG